MKPDQPHDDITRLGWALRRVVSLVYQDSGAMRKKHGVTGLVDRLAQKKLVERIQGDGDRRKVFLCLTGAGARMAGGLRGPMEDKLRSGQTDPLPEAAP